ncbi:MAG: trypsin-like peptidase domain-containing protein, partial [Acidobacteria bacterium]|nr:trypsin-like peptidase domain-containing protein [Acidobacteriota bacterium]
MLPFTPPRPIKPFIVRITDAGGEAPWGAGFVIDRDHVMTCAHVVADATGCSLEAGPGETEIRLDFPFRPGEERRGKMAAWLPEGSRDIAVLRLDRAAPETCDGLRPLLARDFWRHGFTTFGFPEHNPAGTWAQGSLVDEQADGWLQLEPEKSTGHTVDRGFSGAPVWDFQLGGMVGMVV